MKRHRRICGSLRLFILLSTAFLPTAGFEQAAPPVFQLELPEFGLGPTSEAEVTIPSTKLTQILIHILRPHADRIDYGQIYTFVNGDAASTLSEVVPNERGKLVRLRLSQRPGFEMRSGRNTIEIRARNQVGRQFYSSFVLRTNTENRNQDFLYQVDLGADPKQQVPPELVLLEPEREIQLQPGRMPQTIRIAGVATAGTSIRSVSVNGRPLRLKHGPEVKLRRLGLANEHNRVTFDTDYTVSAGLSHIAVDALDAAGNRTQLKIPIVPIQRVETREFRGTKYALVIGISKFKYNDDRLRDLRFADSDALSIYRFLQSPGAGRFLSGNILLLTNEQATLANIRAALTSFVAKPGPDDLLLIFLASHGSPDLVAEQNLYFITHDTQVDRMSETALAMEDCRSMLAQHVSTRRVVLLIDTCHSAGLGEERISTRGIGRNNLINLYVEKLLYKEEGKAVITSSDVNELSQEGVGWGGGHGVFTHFLLEGLRGKADGDGNRVVTVGELFRFVRQKVRLETQFRQNPRMLPGTNEDLALAGIVSRGPER
jgi:hypothetical protein